MKKATRFLSLALAAAITFTSFEADVYAAEFYESAQENNVSDESSEELSEESAEEQIIAEENEETEPAKEDKEEIIEESAEEVKEEVKKEINEVADEEEAFAREHTTEEQELLSEEIEAEQKLLAVAGKAVDINSQGVVSSTINYKYDPNTKTLTITGKGAMPDITPGSAILPGYVNAIYNKDVNIVIEEGITSIGKYNFLFPNSIKSIKLPKSLTKIGDYAFMFNDFQNDLYIPASVVTIGKYAFAGCHIDSTVAIDEASKLKSIPDSCFKLAGLNSIEFPASLTSIAANAFYNCTNLKKIVFKGNMPSIGANAFAGVNALAYYPVDNKTYTQSKMNAASKQFESVTWYTGASIVNSAKTGDLSWSYDEKTKTLRISGTGAMADYSMTDKAPWYGMNIESLVIDSGVTRIGNYAFADMTIARMSMPSTINQIGDYAFLNATCGSNNKPDESFQLSNAKYFTQIGEGSFENATFITNGATVLDLSNAAVIGKKAFYNCWITTGNDVAKLSVRFSNDLKRIEDHTFENATFINGQLTLPNGLTYVGEKAFYNARNISGTLTLPESLVEVSGYAFAKLGISSVNVGDGVKNIMSYAFSSDNNLDNITLGKNVEFVGSHAFHGEKFPVTVNFYGKVPNFGNQVFTQINAVIYSEDDAWDNYHYGDFPSVYQNVSIVFKTKLVPITLNYFNDMNKSSNKQDVVYFRKNRACAVGFDLPNSVEINGQTQYVRGWSFTSDLTSKVDSKFTVRKPISLYALLPNDVSLRIPGPVNDYIMDAMGFQSVEDIPKGVWAYYTKQVNYTGKPITNVDLKVFNNTVSLTEGVDYTAKYSNNINAGKGKITLQFKGSYSGSKTYEFDILPENIAGKNYNVEYKDKDLETIELAYTGKVQKPKLTVRSNAKRKLVENKDFTIKYIGTDKNDAENYNKDAFKAVGTYKIEVIGKGNYVGRVQCLVKIENKIDINKCQITIPKLKSSDNYEEKLTQDGEDYVRYQGKPLQYGKDWTYDVYSDFAKGYTTITFRGLSTGRCVGECVKKIPIKGKKLSSTYVVLDTELDPGDLMNSFSGEKGFDEIQKILKVYTDKSAAMKKDDKKLLKYWYDYNITGMHCGPEGITFNLKAAGGTTQPYYYIGTKTVEFKTKKYKDISKCNVTISPFTIINSKPGDITFDVTSNGKKLKPYVDYTYQIRNSSSLQSPNIDVEVLIRGEGLYYGQKTVKALPSKVNLAAAKIVKNESEINTKNGLVIIFADKGVSCANNILFNIPSFEMRYYTTNPTTGATTYKKLKKNEDYYVTYSNNSKPGKGKVTVKGYNGWTGSKTFTYTINKYETNNIQSGWAAVLEKKNGVNIPTDLNLLNGSHLLKPGVDYTIGKTIYKDPNATKVVGKNEVVKAGTKLYATINYIGNYKSGQSLCEFTVVNNTIEGGKATIADKEFDVKVNNSPSLEDVTVIKNGEIIPKDCYSILSYTSTKKVGVVTVVIQGKSSKGYAGRIVATYRITPKKVVQ
ncbi:Leucine rich repeat-containing protein [Pseudobutyrivibrio sp. OR37]|uniref:leucine-rich repeat domain-containing protein n=1 Tax=Pseudobutyrivibrio sp. OR37 TaxID=1798186 RepID=UPI0008E97188|nr:leucine-rich repeat domain-containing protein [Pseudobutyrivibrio sp. OR37]SFH98928.1 Leucine rich repeat-containing protein [Pseudobutyrivibrio sp. OR37]